ncbi:hypothetical protein EHM92_00280 [bacterium]|nr:MAG: hypothetical protein EHM92_00280 [bacterium]
MKRVAVLQSNYIPWKGYFDLMSRVDEFIVYDNVQMTNNDWRNRNVIKTADGLKWITIPFRHRFGQRIDETEVATSSWARRHWLTLEQNYRSASWFAEYAPALKQLYDEMVDERLLSRINCRFLVWICSVLGIRTRLTRSSEYKIEGDRLERLVNLCVQAGATEYLSGPAAKDYLDEKRFAEAGIAVRYMDYSGYPEYPQLHGAFDHRVSILDLILNAGPDAFRYMRAAA